jgi:imidazolonepropionase-like amidohydrolase
MPLKLVTSKALVDGTGRPPIRNGVILLKDGVIEKIGSPEEIGELPDAVGEIDLRDYYLLPGLIDCHTHLSIVPAQGNQLAQLRLPATTGILRSIPNLQRNLDSGVTMMRIMGQEHYIDIDLKEAIQQKLIQGPRLLVSGIGLVATNGHGVAITVADGENEIIKLARRNFARGADFLKLFVTGGMSSATTSVDFCGYTPKEIAAAVEEAKRAGTYVAAHAHGGRGLDLCIEEGVRTVEHGAFVTPDQLDRMIKRDMWIIGTFAIAFHPEGIEKTDFKVPEIREKVLKARDIVAKNFNTVITSGVNFAVGTDSMHGLISYELECLVTFGASTMRSILAATRDAAKACRMDHKLGTLEKGKLGDFIAVRRNPLEDIKHLRDVDYVYKEGERVKGNLEGSSR